MALPTFKDIAELFKKGATLEAQQKIIELQEVHLAIREELLALKDENRALRAQVERNCKVVWVAPYYYLVDGENRDGPYCQKCYDEKSKLIRMQSGHEGDAHRCAVCYEVV